MWQFKDINKLTGSQQSFSSDPQKDLEPLNPLFPRPDKTTYTMSLSLDVEHVTLNGRTRINTVNTSGRRLGQLWLTVYPNIFRHQSITPVPIS
ncbi:MAG: hypothetical protein ACM3NT_09245, partial [Methylocystaceae bacterium]